MDMADAVKAIENSKDLACKIGGFLEENNTSMTDGILGMLLCIHTVLFAPNKDNIVSGMHKNLKLLNDIINNINENKASKNEWN